MHRWAEDWECMGWVFVIVIGSRGNGVAQYGCRRQEERGDHYSVIAKGAHRGSTMKTAG